MFEGEGEHTGCYMHGVIDECTNERQQLFRDARTLRSFSKVHLNIWAEDTSVVSVRINVIRGVIIREFH